VARSLDEAVRLAEKIGHPVVMKVVSRDILHKSDAGGVALDLVNTEEVIDAYQAIIQSCRAYNPRAVIQGIEVSEMVKRGTEVILGARKDNAFGPVVMVGLGGIYVEVMKDVAFRAAPLNRNEIMSMIEEIKSYPLLLGVRGEGRKDIEGIVDTLVKLATLIQQSKSITDIEINPLMVYEQGQGSKAVDVRVLVSKEI
jgi:succinyl-CoA synthetase beta subunit